MSLKFRLTATMVGMVVAAVLMLFGLQVHGLVQTWLNQVAERSHTTAQFVKFWIVHRVAEAPLAPPGTPDSELRERWREAIAGDEELTIILANALAQTRSIVEISVAGEKRRIVASSSPHRVGAVMPQRLTLSSLMNQGPLDRLLVILGGSGDYEDRVMLGIEGKHNPEPVFTIQVLVSSSLLRESIRPELHATAVASLLALVIAALLAYFAARVALRPLARISDTIDRISAGEIALPAGASSSASEFQAVEQKLRMLGEQFRGAQEGATQLRSTMERRLVAINKLTGGVAHEIKNPLNSIAIRLELLRNHVREVPEAEEEISIISQEITRLDRVVRTFLDFTRPVDLDTMDLDLIELTREILTLIDPEAEAAGVHIHFSYPPEPARVRGDAGLLKQAILNICRNALEAMPAGGTLRVRIDRQPGEALLAIADTGPGISESEKEKIFQLYYSTKEKGTGIGLAMTFRAVQLHGGSIEVDGKEGEGAVFRLRLPSAA